MRVSRMTLALGVVVAILGVAACGGDDDESAPTDTGTTTETTTATGTTLQASVGPGFDISLTGSDGAAVTTLAAGEYTIEVDDQSDIHNFHLTGPGVDEDSGVSETGTSTWTVTLEAGAYHFQCDPHAGSMNGDFDVTG
ncbi:MAG TPA: hypothetical protein VFU99_02000 [Gaiellaceae bacterium]|nr:hypothetical protein [Gaiellaceae bacterium]